MPRGASGRVGAATGWGALPWADWEDVPWADIEKKRAAEWQGWFNTMLPWLQQQVQEQQWGTEFDWRKAMDEWSQQFQTGQFAWQKEADVWSQAFQETQLAQQEALEQSRQQVEQEAASLAAYSRRRRPQTRWM